MSEAHSYYSASGFEATMLCPGKPVMEEGKPDNTSIYAATGTCAHMLLEYALKDGRQPDAFLGRIFPIEGFDIEVDDDMVAAVNTALRNIREIAGDGMVLSEQRVNYADYIGVDEKLAWGTADVIVARGDELQVHDYKNGSGVAVSPVENPQMMLYGLGAMRAVDDLLGPFKAVRLVIHQPNITSAPLEWETTPEQLRAWAAGPAWDAVELRQEAAKPHQLTPELWSTTYLRPGEKQCKFCRAKATCSALRAEVAENVLNQDAPATPEEFADAAVTMPDALKHDAWLAVCMDKADLIEDWVKAVRAEVERRLLAGEKVPGYKIVEGKMGHRKWANPEEVEATMKSMRIKIEDMYDFKLISPTSAEKLAKSEVIGKRQWPKLQGMITQTEGKPHVAPESDSRPALAVTPVVDDFANLEEDLA